MLQAFGLSYEPGPLAGNLFDEIDLAINPGEKVALVGANGCGKSSLLRILAGEIRPTAGRVVSSGAASIAYLPQDFEWDDQRTVLEFLAEQAEAHAVARSAGRLGIHERFYDRRFDSLSLGERMRCALGRLLASSPDVLLLDEPTNHLDIQARQWLEGFLKNCRQSVLMVCHDRAVVNAVATRILELSNGQLRSSTGNFDSFLAARGLEQERQLAEWQKQRDEDRRLRIAAEGARQHAAKVLKKPTGRDYDPAAKGFYSAMEARLAKRAKAIESRIDHARDSSVEKPFVADALSLAFACSPLRSSDVLRVRDLTVSYGQARVFAHVNASLSKGERLGIMGPNGCGKTTLFRALLSNLEPQKGTIEWAPGVEIGYLSQERGRLDPDATLVKALGEGSAARTLLACLGMRGSAALKRVRDLSVGERTKAEIVALLLSPCNVLLLDEPTNHLDVGSLQALENALQQFPGCVIFASHDRTFVEKSATQIIVMAASGQPSNF